MALDIPGRILTDRLILQRLSYEDAEEIFYTYASKPEATRYVAWPTHQSIRDTRNFLSYAVHAWDTGSDFSFGVRLRDGNRLIGGFGIIDEEGKVQFGYILSPTQWQQGYATEMCKAVMDVLKRQAFAHRIWTLVDEENVASARVLEKAGLVEEARLQKWHRFVNQANRPKDCIIYRL